MSQSRLTIIGLNNYTNGGIWDNLTLPEGIDKDILINNIMLRASSFDLLYPDADFLSNMLSIWSNKWLHTFERWLKALSVDYNPLDNYNRYEEWTDGKSNQGSVTLSGSTTGTSEDSVSAFNSSTYQPDSKNTTSNTSTSRQANDLQEDIEHSGHLWGNIGVTTSQQMLEAEFEVAKWNIYEHITDIFIKEFCIVVY